MQVAAAPPEGWVRPPMNRAEFDAACARLEQLYEGAGISCTSHVRSVLRNGKVGGVGISHVKGLGRDYVFDTALSLQDIALCYVICKVLSLRAEFHDAGTGMHLHVQAVY